MKKMIVTLAILLSPLLIMTAPSMHAQAAKKPANNPKCSTSFFGFPAWYKFLKLGPYPDCDVQMSEQVYTTDSHGNQSVNQQVGFKDIWLIALAIVDILMTLAGVIAVVFVIIGGFKYVTSAGSVVSTGQTPSKIANAKNTIVYALIGLVVAILASQIVGYIGHKLGT
jgi:hypothetical protein